MLSRWQLNRAISVVKAGGVIAYPTESVYGLGCDPQNPIALNRLLSLKNRPVHKGLIILVSDISQALGYLNPLSSHQLALLKAPQSRATSWIIPCDSNVSPLLKGRFDSLAVRITSHPVARQLCDALGQGLVSSSCNLAGKKETTKVTRVRNTLYQDLPLIVTGACGHQSPSRIIDLSSGRVIRH